MRPPRPQRRSRSRARSLAAAALALGTFALGLVACAALKESTASDAGAADAGTPPPDQALPELDAAVPPIEDAVGPKPDRGAPPIDSVCPEWAEKSTPIAPESACDARRRMPIASPIPTRRLGVAVTDTGRVVAGYGVYALDDASELHLTHFGAFGPALSAKATVKVGNGLSNELGDSVAVAKGEGDEVHVVSNDFDQAPTGQVVYRRFAGGALGTSSVVHANIPRGAPLALAAGPGGELMVSSFRPTGADAAQGGVAVGMYRPGSLDRFGDPVPFSTTVDARTTPYAGAAALVREPSGLFQGLYCEALSAALGQPTSIAKVRAFSPAGGWGGANAVHNRIPDGLSGLDPALVVRDGVRYATFFHVPANAPSAQLLALVWTGENEPVVTVVEKDIKLPLLGKAASFAQAMAVDSFGQMHVVLHEERPSSASAALIYLRQARIDGLTKWIHEDIDDDVSERDQPGRVAITLDSRDRPHIVYYAQKRATLLYATRFDR